MIDSKLYAIVTQRQRNKNAFQAYLRDYLYCHPHFAAKLCKYIVEMTPSDILALEFVDCAVSKQYLLNILPERVEPLEEKGGNTNEDE